MRMRTTTKKKKTNVREKENIIKTEKDLKQKEMNK